MLSIFSLLSCELCVCVSTVPESSARRVASAAENARASVRAATEKENTSSREKGEKREINEFCCRQLFRSFFFACSFTLLPSTLLRARAQRFMLSRVFASAAPARSLSSCATRRFRYLPLDRRSTLRNLLFAMSQQQGNGEAEQGDRRSTTSASTSTDTDIRTSKKALRSSISATLMALPDEEMARQSEGCLSARAERERRREQNTLSFLC